MAGPNISGPQTNFLVTQEDSTSQFADNRYDGYLAVDPIDNLHMVGICRRFYGPGVNYQDQLEAQYTFDGGQSWKNSLLPLDTASYYSVSDPWIGIAPNGVVYVIALLVVTTDGGTQGSQSEAQTVFGNGVCSYTSEDGGRTWSNPTAIVSGVGCDQTFGAVDPNSGVVYAVWNDLNTGYLGFAYFDGNTWQPSISAKPQTTRYDLPIQGFTFVNLAVAPDDGSIHIVGMNSSGSNSETVSYARSPGKDGAFEFGIIATQQPSGDVARLFLTSDPTSSLPPFPNVANPPTICQSGNGNVFAAWSVNVGNFEAPGLRICVANSKDNGSDWLTSGSNGVYQGLTLSLLLPLGALPQASVDHYFMPRLASAPDGTAGCLFYHIQLVENGEAIPAQLSTCLAVSLAGYFGPGSTRSPEIPSFVSYFAPKSTTAVVVSDESCILIASNPVMRKGVANEFFIGDFIGLCASSLVFFPYWSDTRTGSAQLVTSRLAIIPASFDTSRVNTTVNAIRENVIGIPYILWALADGQPGPLWARLDKALRLLLKGIVPIPYHTPVDGPEIGSFVAGCAMIGSASQIHDVGLRERTLTLGRELILTSGIRAPEGRKTRKE